MGVCLWALRALWGLMTCASRSWGAHLMNNHYTQFSKILLGALKHTLFAHNFSLLLLNLFY